jgi:hypothetical protein
VENVYFLKKRYSNAIAAMAIQIRHPLSVLGNPGEQALAEVVADLEGEPLRDQSLAESRSPPDPIHTLAVAQRAGD